MELGKASPDKLVTALASPQTFEFKTDTIENRVIAKAMKGIKKAQTKLDKKLKELTDGSTVGEVAYELCHNIFKCPVNITVYDSTGKNVGYVGEDDLWYDEDSIYIEQYGDAKHIYSYVGALKFDVVATEPGTLNCVFEELSNGEAVGRVNYYEIPLYTGKSLSVETPAEAFSAETVTCKSEGKTIPASESFSLETYEVSTVNITCNVFGEDGGEVWGSGEYVRGDAVSVQAVPESGYVFLGWQSVNGSIVSVSPVYEFSARDNVILTAMFAEDKEDADDSGSVAITTANVDKRMYSHFLGDFAPIYPLKVAIFNNFAKIRDKAFSQPTRNPRFSSEIALCATFAGTNRPKWKFSVNTASYLRGGRYASFIAYFL